MEKRLTELIEKAKEILRAKGFREDQIYEDFEFKNHRIDVVGWSKEKKIAVECGHSSRVKLEELLKFFDEVIHLPFEKHDSPLTSSSESFKTIGKPFSRKLAGLKLQLVKDDDILFEIPLSIDDWPRDQLENELATLEEEFSSISKVFDALSHETRLRMMKRLLEDSDLSLSFADFMRDLELNPKLVWSCRNF
ncbi:MAG: hypothetical protein QXH91_01240 [Candidatus Bathyarchaeia archaeon]